MTIQGVKRFEFLIRLCTALTIVMFSEYVKVEFPKRRMLQFKGCRCGVSRIIVNVRCCKLYTGKNNGLKFQESYNVSIYHDQTDDLKTNLF